MCLQALAILFGAGFTIAVAYSLGTLMLAASSRDPGIRFVTGAALLSLLVFALGWAEAVHPLSFLLLGLASIAVAWRHFTLAEIPKVHPLLKAAFGIFFLLYFFNAMAPEISYDGSRYHLGLVGRYFREGGFHPIHDNLYAALFQGVEMVYLFAYAFGRHSAASMVHLAFLVALVWQIYRYAERSGFPAVGAVAAILVFASPAVGVVATSAYIDVAVASIAFTLFHILQTWDADRAPRLLAAAGLVAGFAVVAKYTAWLAIPYAVLWILWKSRRIRSATVVAACASLLVVPWLSRNWLLYHNPVAPLFNQQFPNPYFTVSFERDYRRQLELYNLHSRWEIPMQVTTGGSLSGLLGPVFLLAPLALISLRRREGRQLLLGALVFGANYFSNISTRFLLPMLPFVALALALALASWPRAILVLATVHAVLSWPSFVRKYAHSDAWHLNKVTYREALRIKPEAGFLESNLPLYRIDRMLDRLTPPGATVFTLTPIPEAYTSRHIQVAYQAAGNVVSRGVFWSGFHPEHAPRLRLRFQFDRRIVTGIRLIQTTTASGTWSIHELHALDGPAELPGRARWQMAADPVSWGLEHMIDGRPLSFWMCGDSLRAGQSVTATFPTPAAADSVLIEAAPNQPNLKLRLEIRTDTGAWSPGGEPELSEEPPGDFRRAAAMELKRRGIDYLLLFDGEFGADELRQHSADWGVREVGEERGGRLYQLP